MCVACTGLFAGLPAPTGTAVPSRSMQYLWEQAREEASTGEKITQTTPTCDTHSVSAHSTA